MARILLVDDDLDVLGALARLLAKLGHEVDAVASGSEAIRLLPHDGLDLVITDINMPDGDGIEVILAVREVQPGLPVVAISGGGMLPSELLLENAEVLGACHTLRKPLTVEALMDVVGRALDGNDGSSAGRGAG